jgi:hypothetical protein
MRQYDAAAAPMPAAYLNVRAAGLVLHRRVWWKVQEVLQDVAGPTKAEEQYVMLTYVLEKLNEQLFTELMDCFPAATK